MNYHSDEWIMDRVREHYNEALEYFPEDRIVGIFNQGSANYGLDVSTSDCDTKLIVAPTFKEIAMNHKPVSTTHVRANDEHTDWKDIRLYFNCFKKANLNFMEILWTPYTTINPLYKQQWNRLIENREAIARYAPRQAIKSMQGIAHEKYFAMEHHYPSRMEWINKYQMDPKQLHHLLRVEEYLMRYIAGELYGDCLISKQSEFLKEIKLGKLNGKDIDLESARVMAKNAIDNIDKTCKEYLETIDNTVDESVEWLLNDVQYEIMRIAIEKEIEKEA